MLNRCMLKLKVKSPALTVLGALVVDDVGPFVGGPFRLGGPLVRGPLVVQSLQLQPRRPGKKAGPWIVIVVSHKPPVNRLRSRKKRLAVGKQSQRNQREVRRVRNQRQERRVRNQGEERRVRI